MYTFYATKKEKNELLTDIENWQELTCNCGCSIGYINEFTECKVIICDSCHDNCSNFEKLF